MEKELPIPYYLQVAETIRSRIIANHYSQGDLIPSYQQLEKEFNVSNITVRKAARNSCTGWNYQPQKRDRH